MTGWLLSNADTEAIPRKQGLKIKSRIQKQNKNKIDSNGCTLQVPQTYTRQTTKPPKTTQPLKEERPDFRIARIYYLTNTRNEICKEMGKCDPYSQGKSSQYNNTQIWKPYQPILPDWHLWNTTLNNCRISVLFNSAWKISHASFYKIQYLFLIKRETPPQFSKN